jgi:SAM-dependent methyltransferase
MAPVVGPPPALRHPNRAAALACQDGRSGKEHPVNRSHIEFLSSARWAEMLEADLLPWVVSVGDLGDDVLEVGPGPGLTTDLLRARVNRITAVEVDATLAGDLAARLAGTNVEVIQGDATDTALVSNRFSAATCFSMLHHMPTATDQDRLFAEVARVLRPGGILVGVDSRDLEPIRQNHEGDMFTPVPPGTLPSRLEDAGFCEVRLDEDAYQIRFAATKSGAGCRAT